MRSLKVYEKLVRDKIPQIIEASGSKCEIRILENFEHEDSLKTKMQEELKEFLDASEDHQLEELADLVEVIHSFVRSKGVGVEELERIRKAKHEERGGFDEKIMLMSVE
ncbi:nucleoside triphosphate pyrophosphohydrolase [Paenibacillus sp. FSL L8-0506]|uniref:nucleoside triphosphate pyrophosphohydrolase n=1 Tax=Paenibacillus sp. FSL L8-0506 TaxID=2975335 RepID=UPI0030F7F910